MMMQTLQNQAVKQIEIRTISPFEAEAMLNLLPENQRNISNKHVSMYAADMAAGAWHISNDAITITDEGQLINGQHRMTAVVAAGIPQEFLVMKVPAAHANTMFKQMDQGKPRTNADVLKMQGYTRPTHRSALAVAAWRYDQTRLLETMVNNYYRCTPSQLQEWLTDNPPLDPTIDIYNSCLSVSCPAYMVALHYIWGRDNKDFKIPDMFWREVATGNTTYQSGPWWLREKLMRNKAATRKLDPLGRQAEAILAWNAFVEGRSLNRLTWNRARPFPGALNVD